MRRLFKCLLLLILPLLLMACGPVFKTEFGYVPPHASQDRKCVSQCIQSRNACEQICELKNQPCIIKARLAAQKQFNNYRLTQKSLGLPILKKLRDFDQTAKCKLTCNCLLPFNACYTACGGQVLSQEVCVANCGPAAR